MLSEIVFHLLRFGAVSAHDDVVIWWWTGFKVQLYRFILQQSVYISPWRNQDLPLAREHGELWQEYLSMWESALPQVRHFSDLGGSVPCTIAECVVLWTTADGVCSHPQFHQISTHQNAHYTLQKAILWGKGTFCFPPHLLGMFIATHTHTHARTHTHKTTLALLIC